MSLPTSEPVPVTAALPEPVLGARTHSDGPGGLGWPPVRSWRLPGGSGRFFCVGGRTEIRTVQLRF